MGKRTGVELSGSRAPAEPFGAPQRPICAARQQRLRCVNCSFGDGGDYLCVSASASAPRRRGRREFRCLRDRSIIEERRVLFLRSLYFVAAAAITWRSAGARVDDKMRHNHIRPLVQIKLRRQPPDTKLMPRKTVVPTRKRRTTFAQSLRRRRLLL